MGLEAALQGIAMYLAPKQYTARVFTIIAMMDAAAKIVGGPIMMHSFTGGRGAGNQVNGSCFVISSASSNMNFSGRVLAKTCSRLYMLLLRVWDVC